MKLKPCYDLGNEEGEHDIDSQELAEIDWGRIQEQAVANKHYRTCYEPTDLLQSRGMIEAGLKTGISLDLQVGGQSKNDNSPDRGRDDLTELGYL